VRDVKVTLKIKEQKSFVAAAAHNHTVRNADVDKNRNCLSLARLVISLQLNKIMTVKQQQEDPYKKEEQDIV